MSSEGMEKREGFGSVTNAGEWPAAGGCKQVAHRGGDLIVERLPAISVSGNERLNHEV